MPPGASEEVNATFKTVMLWMSLLVVIFLAWHFAQIQKKETSLKFSEFMQQVEAGEVQDVTITGNEIKGHTAAPRGLPHAWRRSGYDKLVDSLLAKKRGGELSSPTSPRPGPRS